jgi:hypothetical protein
MDDNLLELKEPTSANIRGMTYTVLQSRFQGKLKVSFDKECSPLIALGD